MFRSKKDFQENISHSATTEKKKRKWLKPVLIIAAILLFIGGVAFWKAGSVLNKISTDGNLFGSLAHMIPGVEDKLKGEEEGRINVLLLGMRGENVPGGGTLADTIMVASINPKDNAISMLSVPRDFYVDNPAVGYKTKINAVYAYGEEDGKKQGVENMKKVISDVVGAPIHYALVINFKGFSDLVNAIGGIEVTLEKPFEEAMQFNEERVCDSYVFTKPTGKYEYKYYTRSEGTRYLAKTYPLCTNPVTECGGDFKLPAGTQTLDGDKALCYARSRKTTSDFERAKRQQIIIQKIKEKALAIGTLSDFSKVNAIMDSLGDNVKTDMQAWEMKRLYEIERGMNSPRMLQHVLENSEEGLLYTPQSTPETGYILAPIGDNYDKIRDLFQNIFSRPSQSDIKPV